MPTEEDQPELETLRSPWISCDQSNLWAKVLSLGQRRLYRKKQLVIQANEEITHLYYLKTGRVKTTVSSTSGQQKTIWYIDAGCIFGETPFFNRKSCDYCFHAVTDCEVYLFDNDVIYNEVIPKFPELVTSMLTILTRKVHILSTQIEYLTFDKPLIRVAKLIYLMCRNSESDGNECLGALPITQEELADILGLHRVTISNTIRQLKHLQILADNTHLIIKDLPALKELSKHT